MLLGYGVQRIKALIARLYSGPHAPDAQTVLVELWIPTATLVGPITPLVASSLTQTARTGHSYAAFRADHSALTCSNSRTKAGL